jgi:rod shape-determining protein MreC
VRAENEDLRTKNDRLRAELLEAKRGAAESVRFQHLLGLRNAVAAETLVARVIAIDVSPYFRVARIQLDRGESLVQRGMPVITPEGVVGRINRTSGETSDIMLSVDPRSAIDVVLPRTGGRGILKGKPGENGYRCAIEYLMQGEQAKEGDVVVTSGLGGFPRDLPVGKISKIVKNAAGLTQDIEITPDVDFARLSEVLIVVAPAPPVDPDAGSKKPLVPAHGLAVYR